MCITKKRVILNIYKFQGQEQGPASIGNVSTNNLFAYLHAMSILYSHN